jgi:hypothetical protein
LGLSTEEPLAAGDGWQLPPSGVNKQCARDGIGLRAGSTGAYETDGYRSRYKPSPRNSNTYNTRRVRTPKTFIEASAGTCHRRRKPCGTSRLFQSGTNAALVGRDVFRNGTMPADLPRLDRQPFVTGRLAQRGFEASAPVQFKLSTLRQYSATHSPLSPKLRSHRQCGRDRNWN